MKTKVIILFGPPGAGKGTQAELLAEKLGFYYIEPSKILERKFSEAENKDNEQGITVDGKEYKIADEKKLWKGGFLCSPEFVTGIFIEKIRNEHNLGNTLILAGCPRTIYEGEKEIPVLKELYGTENIVAIVLEISPEETISRNSNRKICELMRHPILFSEETKNLSICPLDGSKLVKRAGLDDVETIKVRIKEYNERTHPLIELFKKEGIRVETINGEQSVVNIHKEIINILN